MNMQSILIIEDDETLSEMYKDKLSMSNYSVYAESDGERGLQYALKHKPNLILLDISLPKMNGIDIMKLLREDQWGKNVPIIVLTNLNVDGEILEGVMKYSPAYCFMKANIVPEDVVTKTKEILSEKKHQVT